jgi:cobalt-zinc-cadmium efflux system outer membrane protein
MIKRAHTPLQLLAASAAMGLLMSGARAQSPSLMGTAWAASVQGTPWADEALVIQALQARPAWRLALQSREAEHAQSEVTRLGTHEWSADFSAGTRWKDDPLQRRSREWELGLQRPWRSDLKARVADEQGQAQRAQADLGLALQWQGLSLALMDDIADWVNLNAQAQTWQRQHEAMAQFTQAANQRVRLGEGAELDARQAEAAQAQARLQWELAQQRVHSAQSVFAQRWPQWTWSAVPALSAGEEVCTQAPPAGAWTQAMLDEALSMKWAQTVLQQARAQAQADAAQTTPDPTVGVKGGQAGNGAERYVGLTFSMPWGGPARDAQARASARRLAVAEQGVEQAQEAAQAQAITEVALWQSACSQWQLEGLTLASQTKVALALSRGHTLGEGSMQTVLQAQAMANELRLRSEQARTQAWRAWSRMLVLTGALWPSSPVLQAASARSAP